MKSIDLYTICESPYRVRGGNLWQGYSHIMDGKDGNSLVTPYACQLQPGLR